MIDIVELRRDHREVVEGLRAEIEGLRAEITRRDHLVALERAETKRLEVANTLYWGEMAKLQAEIERLTAALQEIADSDVHWRAVNVARVALAGRNE